MLVSHHDRTHYPRCVVVLYLATWALAIMDCTTRGHTSSLSFVPSSFIFSFFVATSWVYQQPQWWFVVVSIVDLEALYAPWCGEYTLWPCCLYIKKDPWPQKVHVHYFSNEKKKKKQFLIILCKTVH